jgi:hypothetical protein
MPVRNPAQYPIEIQREQLETREKKSRGLIGCIILLGLLLIAALTVFYLSNPLRDRTILYIIIGVSVIVCGIFGWFVVIPLGKSFFIPKPL